MRTAYYCLLRLLLMAACACWFFVALAAFGWFAKQAPQYALMSLCIVGIFVYLRIRK